tara:strand:- start:39 stop:416 length:378 start_codon:yes stop_codon:yes gene_type:complete
MKITIEVSVGELYDKISILRIKQNKLTNPSQLVNVNKELKYLESKAFNNDPTVTVLVDQLYLINLELWDIENAKRECEAKKDFGDKFIQLARDVYIKNDMRAKLKKQINKITLSDVIEEKDYTSY